MFRTFAQLLSPPELEKLSDEEAERLIWQAKFRRGDAIWVLPGAAGLLAGGAWVALAVILTLSFRAIAGGQLISVGFERWTFMNAMVAIAFFFAAAALTRWIMIVRSVRLILNRAACPFCDFSLVGLNISNNSVTCPECGQTVMLHEHRISEADIEIPRPFAAAGRMGAYRETLQGEGRKAKGERNRTRARAATGKSSR